MSLPRRLTSLSFRYLTTTHQALAVKPLLLSDIGEGTRDVEIMKFVVKEGQEVTAWDDIVEVQSDKASVNIQTPKDGRIVKIHYQEGDIVKVGKALCDIDYFGDVEEEEVPQDISEDVKPEKKIFATPKVKELAKKHGIELESIKGTGSNGRITKDDIFEVFKVKILNSKFLKHI